MSTNTYFTRPDQPGIVYKTQDVATRRRLKRHGWQKQRRDQLERTYTRAAMCTLSECPDGEYAYGGLMIGFVRRAAFTPVD